MAVDARLLKQIKHKDPQLRRKAIVALADSRDAASLKPLADIAETDPEPKLRDLATRAAKHLQEQMEKAAAHVAQAASQHKESEPEVRVSEKQMARGRAFLDEAMSMLVAKDMAKATKALSRALNADPSLKSDSYFLSLAGNVFNTSGEEAVIKLSSSQERTQFVKAQEQGKVQKRKDDHVAKAREIGWSSVAFDLAIYAVVVGIISFFAPIVYAQLITRTAEYQATLEPVDRQQEIVKIPRDMQRASEQLLEAGAAPLIVPAAINAVASGVSMLGLGFLVHLLATKAFRGKGTLPFMMSQLVPFYSLMTPVFFIWSCLVMGMISVGAGLIGMLCLPLMSLGSFVVFFKSAGKIGSAYDFGSLKGCLSLILASVVLGLVATVLSSLLFGAVLSNALSTMGIS